MSNCGIKVLEELSLSKLISLYILQKLAKVNGQDFFIRKVEDVFIVPLPAVFHSPGHFSSKPSKRCSGYILCNIEIGIAVSDQEADTILGGKGGMTTWHLQAEFLGRRDNGKESIRNGAPNGATDIAGENSNFSWFTGVPFRLRILMSSQSGGNRNRAVRMRSNKDLAGYVVVTTATANVKITPSNYYSNQSNSTEGIIVYPTGTWADLTNFHRVDNSTNTGNCNYQGDGTEKIMAAEFCMIFDTDGSYQFRLQRSTGINLSSYLATPTITVTTPDKTFVDVKGSNIDLKGSNIDIK